MYRCESLRRRVAIAPARRAAVTLAVAVALVLSCCLSLGTAFAAETRILTILHWNDLHGRLEAFVPSGQKDAVGGMGKLASLIAQVRGSLGSNAAILILNGGDSLHGTNLANLFFGKPVVEVYNAVGVQAMAVGNHEFNFGQTVLLERQDQAGFPFLSANTIETASGRTLLKGVMIVPVAGLRVAVLGLSPTDTPVLTFPSNVAGLEFRDPAAIASWMVPYLRDSEKVDLVVCLSHLGYEEDRKLAAAVPGIDVIVGGHSHTRLEQPVVVGSTVIVQAGEYGCDLGVLALAIEDRRVVSFDGRLLPASPQVPEDGKVVGLLADDNKALQDTLGRVVGETKVVLDGERANVRTRETNLGNLVADIMREAAKADIALTNGGGIRASINPGSITLGSIYTVLPFDNTLVALELAGRDILKALELSVSKYPEQLGGFLHVSGLAFAFDSSKPAGSRVVRATVGDALLDPDKTYVVATNDFLAAGGDNYAMFKDARKVFNSGLMLRDVAADYVAKAGTVKASVEGRIVVLK